MREDLQLKIQIKMTQEMQRRTQARRDLRLTVQVSSTLTQCGQTISRYLLITSHILRKPHSNLRQKIGRKSGDDMNDLDTNSLIWRISMSATLDAAIHLGKHDFESVYATKYLPQRTIRHLFEVTEVDHRSDLNSRFFRSLDWHTYPWQRTTLLTDNAVQVLSGRDESIPRVHKWCMGSLSISRVGRIDGGTRAGKFSQDSLHYRFSPRSRK